MARSAERKTAMRGSKKREPSSAFDPDQDWGEDVEGPAKARQRRAGDEAEACDRKAGTGKRAATVRSAASRSATRKVGERAGEGSEATEPRARAGRGLEACTCKRSAQRASASAGDRDRHPKGEDRVSGLRGAGRGEAAPGGIEPGARSLDRAVAPIMAVGERAISGRLRTRGRRGGALQEGGAGSTSGAGAKRRAAMRDTGHGVKKGPVPRRSEGPALAVVKRRPHAAML